MGNGNKESAKENATTKKKALRNNSTASTQKKSKPHDEINTNTEISDDDTFVKVSATELRQIVNDAITSAIDDLRKDFADRLDLFESTICDKFDPIVTNFQKIKTEIADLKRNMNQLSKVKIAETKNMETSRDTLKQNLAPALDEVMKERKWIEEKKDNIVLLGVAESAKPTAGEKKDDDGAEISNVFAELGYNWPEKGLKDYVRIGKVSEKPRPILIKFWPEEHEKRSELLKLAKNLAKLPKTNKRCKYFIKPDLTKKQQQAEKDLYEQLKKKRADQPDQTFYIKNGKIRQKLD